MMKKKNYDPDTMAQAVQAAREAVNKSAVAREFGVPRQTLVDKVNGKHSEIVGKPRLLGKSEEESLKNYILYCSSIGLHVTNQILRCQIQGISDIGHTLY